MSIHIGKLTKVSPHMCCSMLHTISVDCRSTLYLHAYVNDLRAECVGSVDVKPQIPAPLSRRVLQKLFELTDTLGERAQLIIGIHRHLDKRREQQQYLLSYKSVGTLPSAHFYGTEYPASRNHRRCQVRNHDLVLSQLSSLSQVPVGAPSAVVLLLMLLLLSQPSQVSKWNEWNC